MNRDEINIETIKQYLAGKLDVKAMHQLEKQALKDPFLGEAMDGLLENPKNSVDALSSLQEKLNSRVEKKKEVKTKKINFRPWLAVAAVILIFIGLGLIFQFQNHSQKSITDEIVKSAVPVKVLPKNMAIVKTEEPPKGNVQLNKNSSQRIKENSINKSRDNEKQSSLSEDNLVALQMKQSSPIESSANKIIDTNTAMATNFSSLLQGRVAGLTIDHKPESEFFSKRKNINKGINTAKIVDETTGKPIAGAIASYKDNFSPSVSDSLGQFAFPDSARNVDISALGYVAINTPVKENAVIHLAQRNPVLNDVVVIGYGTQKKQSITGSIETTMPIIGWDEFAKYVHKTILDNYAIGETGTVKVSFKVNTDGTLSNFKILKGLNTERNKQAIEILKNGSKWMMNAAGKKAVTIYEIVFP